MVTFTATITRHFMQTVDFISCHKHIILISYVLTVHLLNIFGKDNIFFTQLAGGYCSCVRNILGDLSKAAKNIITSLLIATTIWSNVIVNFIRFVLWLWIIELFSYFLENWPPLSSLFYILVCSWSPHNLKRHAHSSIKKIRGGQC